MELWIRNMYGNIKLQSQKNSPLAFASFIITILMLLLLLLLLVSYSHSHSHKAFAASPAFDEVLISDQDDS
jgi:hypothetical protein